MLRRSAGSAGCFQAGGEESLGCSLSAGGSSSACRSSTKERFFGAGMGAACGQNSRLPTELPQISSNYLRSWISARAALPPFRRDARVLTGDLLGASVARTELLEGAERRLRGEGQRCPGETLLAPSHEEHPSFHGQT